MKYLKIIFSLLLVVNLSACGYTTRSMVDPNLKTIFVEQFSNEIDLFSEGSQDTNYRSYYPLLERDITNKIIERFVFDGNLKISKRDKADLIMTGKLLRYQRDAVRYEDNDEDVKEYRISLVVDLALYNTQLDKEVWHEPGFVGDATYFVSGASAKSESAVIADAINDLAKRVVERVVEDW